MNGNVRVLPKSDVLRICGYSSSQLWLQEQAKLFPSRVKVSSRSAGWPENEVRAVMTARIAGVGNDGIRALVERLHERRQQRYAQMEAEIATVADSASALTGGSGAIAA
jgi:prophage regulatory protein